MTDELKVGLNKCLSAKRKCMQKVDIRCPRNLCLTSVQCQQRAFVRVSYYEHWLTDCTDRGINASRTSQWRTTMMRSSHALVCVHRRRRTFRKGIYLHYVNEEWVRRSFSQARRSPFLRERGKKSQDGDLLGSCLTPTHKNGNVRTNGASKQTAPINYRCATNYQPVYCGVLEEEREESTYFLVCVCSLNAHYSTFPERTATAQHFCWNQGTRYQTVAECISREGKICTGRKINLEAATRH